MAEDKTDLDIDQFDQLDWSDISGEMARNKEMLRDEQSKNIAVTTETKPNVMTGEVELDFLHDVSLDFTVEVGSRKLRIQDILRYKVGSIIELDNMVGQPLNIFVNDVLVGVGEIVEREKKFGIKITELLNEEQRLEALSQKALPQT